MKNGFPRIWLYWMLAENVHRDPSDLLIEVVQRALCAYRALGATRLQQAKIERAVVISRQRHASGTSHIFVEDNGAGFSLKDERHSKLIHWALLGAGSKIVIQSRAAGAASRFRLELNVRRIYEKRCVKVVVKDLLRDPECSSLLLEKCDPVEHGTTLTVECDGEHEVVNGLELNCFYDFTDPEDKTVKQILTNSPLLQSAAVKSQNNGRRSLPSIYLDGMLLACRP